MHICENMRYNIFCSGIKANNSINNTGYIYISLRLYNNNINCILNMEKKMFYSDNASSLHLQSWIYYNAPI